MAATLRLADVRPLAGVTLVVFPRCSAAKASGSMQMKPDKARPANSIGRTCGSRSACSRLSAPTRTISAIPGGATAHIAVDQERQAVHPLLFDHIAPAGQQLPHPLGGRRIIAQTPGPPFRHPPCSSRPGCAIRPRPAGRPSSAPRALHPVDAGDPPVQAVYGVPPVLGYGRVLPDLRHRRDHGALARRACAPSAVPAESPTLGSPTCSSRPCSPPPGNRRTHVTSRWRTNRRRCGKVSSHDHYSQPGAAGCLGLCPVLGTGQAAGRDMHRMTQPGLLWASVRRRRITSATLPGDAT